MIQVIFKPGNRSMRLEAHAILELVLRQQNVTQIICGDQGIEVWTGAGPALSADEKIAWAREELGISFGGCCG